MPGAARRLPASWQGSTLLVTLPDHVDESNARLVRSQLLAAVNCRPRDLIADMSGTAWCDWACAGVIAYASRQAVAGGTDLRLVVTDDYVRRVLTLNGLGRLIQVSRDPPDAPLSAGPRSGGPGLAQAEFGESQAARLCGCGQE